MEETSCRLWRIAAIILNEVPDSRQGMILRIGGGVDEVLTTSHRKNLTCYEMYYKTYDWDRLD